MGIAYLDRKNMPMLAYRKLDSTEQGMHLPLILFCGGFRSDMEGTKAQYLEEYCRARGQGYIRFDYSGHGVSEGNFEDGTIGIWTQDTLAILDTLTEGPVIIVGSSMGGWIALLVALARPCRISGLIGLAAAPDFTKEIYEQEFDDTLRQTMQKQGYVDIPNDYSDEPYRITKALIDDGEKHCLLDKTIGVNIPICLIQGMQDSDVSWQKAHRIKNALAHPDKADVVLIESADHRLSRPEDLALLKKRLGLLLEN